MAQLEAVNTEILRQLTAANDRQESIRTRATILIAAAGILSTFPAQADRTIWHLSGVFLAVAAALLGLIAAWPLFRKVADADESFDARINADPYSTLFSIVSDNRIELRETFKMTENMARYLRTGYLLLVLSWLATSTAIALKTFGLI